MNLIMRLGINDDEIGKLRALGVPGKEVATGIILFEFDESHPLWRQIRKVIRPNPRVAHRVLDKRFAKMLGVSANEMQSMAFRRAAHRLSAFLWREALPHGSAGTAHATADDVRAAAREVYKDCYPQNIVVSEAIHLAVTDYLKRQT